MKILKTEGIVIRRRNFGEADKLLTIFTKSNGKITVKAPGIRKVASRRSPHVELLNRTKLTLYTNGNMPLLSEAEMISDYKFIKNDLLKVGFGYHICEVIDGLCPENEYNEDVFTLLVQTLDTLCVEEDTHELIRNFELRLLDLLGFANRRMWTSDYFNVQAYIESLMEKKLKSKDIFLNKP